MEVLMVCVLGSSPKDKEFEPFAGVIVVFFGTLWLQFLFSKVYKFRDHPDDFDLAQTTLTNIIYFFILSDSRGCS